jgi:hypothetical protein
MLFFKKWSKGKRKYIFFLKLFHSEMVAEVYSGGFGDSWYPLCM